MTTITSALPATVRATTFADSVPLHRLVTIEARKLADTRAARWLLGVITVGTIVAAGAMPFIARAQANSAITNHQAATWSDAVSLVQLASLLLPVMVILLVTSEWTQRGALTTYLLEPRRLRVVGAKAIVAASAAIMFSMFVMALTALAGVVTNATLHLGVDWVPSVRQALGLIAYTLLSTSIAFGFGLVLMNSPAAIVSYLLIPSLLPLLVFIPGAASVLGWVSIWENMSRPMSNDWSSNGVAKLVVSALIWIVAPIVGGVVRHLRTEVK